MRKKKGKKENYCLQHILRQSLMAPVHLWCHLGKLPGLEPVGSTAGKRPSLGCGWDEVCWLCQPPQPCQDARQFWTCSEALQMLSALAIKITG